MTIFRPILDGFADLIYPPTCEHCDRRAERHEPLCWRCLRRLEPVPYGAADLLLEAFALEDERVRIRCQWYFDRQGPLRDVIHALKYSNRPWYGTFLGSLLAGTIGPVDADTLIVPLPLHRVRLLERGYNQAEWISAEMARTVGIRPAKDVMIRKKPTGTQTTLTRDLRWQNVRDAFSVTDEALASGRRIVLVDDVVTTGATALSAALSLQGAGADSVTIAAVGLARA